MANESKRLALAADIEHHAEANHNRAVLKLDEDSRRIAQHAKAIMKQVHELTRREHDGT